MGSIPRDDLLAVLDGGADPTVFSGSFAESILEVCFEKHVSKVAITSIHQTTDPLAFITGHQSGQVSWTYGQLHQAATLMATRLRKLGHRDEDKLVAILPNQIEWALLLCVAMLLKSTFVPLFPNVMTNSREAEHMFETIGTATMFVQNAKLAATVEEILPTQMKNMRIKSLVDADHNRSGWMNFSDLFVEPSPSGSAEVQRPTSSFAMIFFTSGTTSLPKACLHSDKILLSTLNGSLAFEFSSKDSFCIPLPSNHIFCVNAVIWMWTVGGSIVYPSVTFSAEATLHALEVGKCSHVALVPTMLYALLEHPNRTSTDLSNLHTLITGAASPPISLIERAMSKSEGLGLKFLMNGYGMTEANLAVFHREARGPVPIVDGQVVTGTLAPGAKARVCKPGTRDPVLRGERGDLHNGGVRVIHGYLNADSSSFYQDESDPEVWWLASGDQAEIDHQGNIVVIGRYKDLIIRGGENISPSSIETLLDSIPGIKSQVVGYPDEVAGEVPVYVIWTEDGSLAPQNVLMSLVLMQMGSRYSPRAILHIKHDLGHNIWPLTASGKPKKVEIAKLVKNYLDESEQSQQVQSGDTKTEIAQIWASLSGNTAQSLLENEQHMDIFADSLMIMQFVSRVNKRMNKTITVSDLALHPTISEQAQLLDSRSGVSKQTNSVHAIKKNLRLIDMVHCKTQKDVESSIATIKQTIEPLNLTWEQDVEAVIPTYDFGRVLMRPLRPQSWNMRLIQATSQANVVELRKAVEAMLEVQPMLRTIGVHISTQASTQKPRQGFNGTELLHEGTVVHVVLRPSKKYYNIAIRDGFQVQNAEDLNTINLDDPVLDHGCYPGPLIRFTLVEIKSTGTAGLIFNGNHSAFDASSSTWFEDISQILEKGISSLQRHADYKPFADLYHLHRHGSSAERSARFFADRLKGVGKLVKKNVIWPRQVAPEWFKGDFSGWHHSDGSPGKAGERSILDDETDKVGVNGVTRSATLPNLPLLKAKYNLPASMVMKTACAIFNIRHLEKKPRGAEQKQEGDDVDNYDAIFSSYVASRTWPFIEDYSAEQRQRIASTGEDIMDLAGPCLECLINRIPISLNSDTGLSLLQKVQRLQDEDSKHAHAPLSLIQSYLPQDNGDDNDDATELIPLLRRQIFNWLPMILPAEDTEVDKTKLIYPVSFTSRSDVGVLWNVGLTDHKNVKVNVSYDDTQLRKSDMEKNLEEFLNVARWLCDLNNLDRKIKDIEF